MSLSLPPPHHRFGAVLISSTFMMLFAEIPLLFSKDWTATNVIMAALLNFFFSSVLWYWWLFGDNRPIRKILIFHVVLLVMLHPFVFGIHHWEVMRGSGELLALDCCAEFINLNFGIIVLAVSTVGAYVIALKKSDGGILNSYSSIEWTLLTIDMKNKTFGSTKNLPFIHQVYWPLCLLGGSYLVWFINHFTGHAALIANVQIIAIFQMIAMILAYRLGLVLGEGFRLIQIERMTPGVRFHLENFDEFLKWRHDYVKYHLPAAIRKLNLRLFNQHVEAYENLQK